MPFYEYQCQACGAQVEVLQKITDAPLKKCTKCGKSRLVKLVSAPVFRLKGGGWYETDFKTDKDKQRNLVDSEKGESKSDDKSDSKVEAKPETKAETKSESKEAVKAEAKPAKKPAAKPVKASRSAKKKARR
jgi:putative FmdB family regulatory protein